MKISEIPASFIKVSDTQWNDQHGRMMYFVDPINPTLLVWRPWSQEEVAAVDSIVAIKEANRVTLNTATVNSIQKLIDDIGPSAKLPNGTANPALVPGTASLNAIIADTRANINANPSAYITQLAKSIKTTEKALIALLKVTQGLTNDTNIGSE